MAMQEHKRAANRTGQIAKPDQIYSLKFSADRRGTESGGDSQQTIEFLANNAYQALVIAHREGGGRSAELWRDGKRLCTISELAGSFWEIRPCAAEAAGGPATRAL